MSIHPPSIQTIYNSRGLTGPLTQSVLLIVVIALFGWFLVRPEFTQTSAQHEELRVATQKREAVENDKRELNRLISELQSAEQEVKITDEALPLIGRVSRVDVLVDTLAKSSGLQVSQINASDTADSISAGNKAVLADPYGAERSLQTTTVSVLVSGTIDQFRNFLQLLETSGRVLDVSSLEVTSEAGSTKFRISIKAYAYEVDSGVNE